MKFLFSFLAAFGLFSGGADLVNSLVHDYRAPKTERIITTTITEPQSAPDTQNDPDPQTYTESRTNHTSKPVSYYVNTDGDMVQSPTKYDSAPAGATALCHDGTYSFSKNRRGTCSHHGGVQKWLK
jgi:hypothetical protein